MFGLLRNPSASFPVFCCWERDTYFFIFFIREKNPPSLSPNYAIFIPPRITSSIDPHFPYSHRNRHRRRRRREDGHHYPRNSAVAASSPPHSMRSQPLYQHLPNQDHDTPPLIFPPSQLHFSYPTPPVFSNFFSSIPVSKSAFDLTTIFFIASLLLLSLLSLSFIFYLRLKSRRFQHLENFNSLWTVRLLVVLLCAAWAVNETLRLPLVRRKYIFSFLPSISQQEHADICRIHVILSLGILEPSFLVTLLFLVNVSIKKKNPSRMWALASVFLVCSPMTALQILFVYFSPLEERMSKFMPGHDVCVYPFVSCILFGGFAAVYAVVFLFSCWRVMALVINKGMRRRIGSLAAAVMVALLAQIACLSLSWLWKPEDLAHGLVVLAMFLFVAGSMAIGEVILVIKPITDALAAGRHTL